MLIAQAIFIAQAMFFCPFSFLKKNIIMFVSSMIVTMTTLFKHILRHKIIIIIDEIKEVQGTFAAKVADPPHGKY